MRYGLRDLHKWIAFIMGIWLTTAPPVAAQDRARTPERSSSSASRKGGAAPSKPRSPKRKRKSKRSHKAPPKDTRKLLADKPRPEGKPADATASAHAATAPAEQDDANVRSEGGKDVKTIEFTGIDIEGQLKTPQMLFFMNRLRAEFDRPRLPHRSFIPELARSRESKEL